MVRSCLQGRDIYFGDLLWIVVYGRKRKTTEVNSKNTLGEVPQVNIFPTRTDDEAVVFEISLCLIQIQSVMETLLRFYFTFKESMQYFTAMFRIPGAGCFQLLRL